MKYNNHLEFVEFHFTLTFGDGDGQLNYCGTHFHGIKPESLWAQDSVYLCNSLRYCFSLLPTDLHIFLYSSLFLLVLTATEVNIPLSLLFVSDVISLTLIGGR